MSLVRPPYPIFTETDGQPLENGYLWIGEANLDPQLNPIAVYFDAALTQPASQPIRTGDGYPVNAGTPAQLYIGSGEYSIRVTNKNGSLIYNGAGVFDATVYSVGMIAGTGMTVSGSPITTAGDITVAMADTAVTAGSYAIASVVVDQQGRLTSASSAVASTAEAQTGAANDVAITPLRMREGFNATGGAPVYACRAWVNFNGVGAATIRDSGNIAGVVRNGVGDYTINFFTPMPDENYSVVISHGYDATSFTAISGANVLAWQQNPTASSVRIGTWYYALGVRTPQDSEWVYVAIFR